MIQILTVAFFLLFIVGEAVSSEFYCIGKMQAAAEYSADGGLQLSACFDMEHKTVKVRMPDATVVTLPVDISASGARYSNGKQTFWEHQGMGRFFEGEKLLFEGKLLPRSVYAGGAVSRLLKKTTVTANGQKIIYPATDNAEVTAMLVEIPPGGETGWHKHLSPVYAYLLSGGLEVEMDGGVTFRYSSGQAVIEVVDAFHNGRNRGKEPVKLVVLYLGIQGVPNAVKRAPESR